MNSILAWSWSLDNGQIFGAVNEWERCGIILDTMTKKNIETCIDLEWEDWVLSYRLLSTPLWINCLGRSAVMGRPVADPCG